MCFGKSFPPTGLTAGKPLGLGRRVREKVIFTAKGVQLYLVSTEEGRKHFYDTTYSEGVYVRQTLHPELRCGTTFSPVLTDLIETSPFSSLRGSAVTAIAALALQRAPWERYQGTEDCRHLCFSCAQCSRRC